MGRPAKYPVEFSREAVELVRQDPDNDPKLTKWVTWLIERYELGDVLPACWAQHGAIVEELDALRIGWIDLVDQGSGDLGPAQWHDYLHRALDRIDGPRWRTYLDGNHRSTEGPPCKPTKRLAVNYEG